MAQALGVNNELSRETSWSVDVKNFSVQIEEQMLHLVVSPNLSGRSASEDNYYCNYAHVRLMIFISSHISLQRKELGYYAILKRPCKICMQEEIITTTGSFTPARLMILQLHNSSQQTSNVHVS
ncbi:hypothetical protein D5086_007575 [Populus alba]|uniref:Uncharacterized protein n=1 Tax=Populus alba TaxID=43335 RepID=A0ACC4CNX3_POPAL